MKPIILLLILFTSCTVQKPCNEQYYMRQSKFWETRYQEIMKSFRFTAPTTQANKDSFMALMREQLWLIRENKKDTLK